MTPMDLRTPIAAFGTWLLVAACGSPTPPTSRAPHPADSLKTAPIAVQPARQDTVRNGHETIRRADGSLMMEGNKLDGKRHGEWTSYDVRGRVQSRNDYENGVLQGQTVVYRANGAPYYIGANRNGKPVGLWTFYDDQGDPSRTVLYDSTGKEVPQP